MPRLLRSDTVYHFCEGHDATQHAAFGEAAHIAITLRMHEESSYEGLDLIECEVRRRTFWLLFGGTYPEALPSFYAHTTSIGYPVSDIQPTSQCRSYWDVPSPFVTKTPRATFLGSWMTSSECLSVFVIPTSALSLPLPFSPRRVPMPAELNVMNANRH